MTQAPIIDFRSTDFDNLRIPPHSIEAESSLLGALLLDNEALSYITGKIELSLRFLLYF